MSKLPSLLSLAVALIAGLLMSRLTKKCKLPSVTAYLITGILVGPFGLGRLGVQGLGFPTLQDVEKLDILSDVALGFIAFAIGNEFRLSQLKQTGKQAAVVGVSQALFAALLVDAALLWLHTLMPDRLTVPVAITLGAIATATAPAATLMVIRQYKARGKVTDILLPVVALDDAVGLVVFAISFGIARAMRSGTFNAVSVVVEPLLEIVLSLGFGALMGVVLTHLEKLFNSNSNRLSLTIGFVLLTVALSMLELQIGEVQIGFSSLLVCMMLGTVFCNLCPLSGDLMEKADRWTAPLFTLFFVISGAELELNVFGDAMVVLVGVVYILVRSIGKYTGAYLSAKATGCEPNVVKYLGITLLPQAGVALGMCLTAMQLGPVEGAMIRNITLFAVFIYEIIGPLLTKLALTASGDIRPMSDEVKNRRAIKLQAADQQQDGQDGSSR